MTRWILDGAWGWLPRAGTTEQTVVLYAYALRATAFVVGVGAVFALGYRIGTRLDLRADYRRLVLAVGLGGPVGYVAAILLFALFSADGLGLAGSTPLVGALVLGRAIGVSIQFVVVGSAGAAFADVTTDAGRSGGTAPATEDGGGAVDVPR